jgi:CYTH domain-containing protein
LTKVKESNITQSYLNYEPQVRIRKSNNEYTLTIKNGTGLIRHEVNLPITINTYEELLTISKSTINKIRTVYTDGKHNYEHDALTLCGETLEFIEVEFETEQDAYNFEIPTWFTNDTINVTNIDDYSMASLAQQATNGELVCLKTINSIKKLMTNNVFSPSIYNDTLELINKLKGTGILKEPIYDVDVCSNCKKPIGNCDGCPNYKGKI